MLTNKKKFRKVKTLRNLHSLRGETGKQKQFSTFPNKLFYNMLLQEKNTNFLFFVADMSLDTTLILIENQQI